MKDSKTRFPLQSHPDQSLKIWGSQSHAFVYGIQRWIANKWNGMKKLNQGWHDNLIFSFNFSSSEKKLWNKLAG